jgi:hypothetical protein
MSVDDSASNIDGLEKTAEMLGLVLTSLASIERRVNELSEAMLEIGSKQEWYGIAETARRLGKAQFTVREWCRLGRINALRTGSKITSAFRFGRMS